MPRIPEDYFTNTVAGAAAYEVYRSGGADYGPEPDYSHADAMADAADTACDYEDGLFEVDAQDNCTLCGGSGDVDYCPRGCSSNGHQDCQTSTCPQCEGEGSRETEEDNG